MQNVTQDSICANTNTRNMGNPHNMPYVTKKSLEKGDLSRKTVQELQSKSMQTSLAAKMREKIAGKRNYLKHESSCKD